MLRKKLIVLEGPAGAGKTHGIQWFRQYHPEVPALERRKEVQGFRQYDSEYWPLTLDLDYLMAAIFRPEDVFLVDRFWINSLVYQPFRYPVPGRYGNPARHPSPYAVNETLGRLVRTAEELITTARLRDWNVGNVEEFHISYHILIPHRDVLENNRKLSGKEYPFDPAVETLRYLRVALGAQDMEAGPVRVTVDSHLIHTYDDYYPKVQLVLDRELNAWRKKE